MCYQHSFIRTCLLMSATLMSMFGFIIGLTSENDINLYILSIGLIASGSCIFVIISYIDNRRDYTRNNPAADIENTIDTIDFKKYKKRNHHKISNTDNTDNACSICLEDVSNDCFCFKDCRHVYHDNCIKTWIITDPSSTCPLCRKTYP